MIFAKYLSVKNLIFIVILIAVAIGFQSAADSVVPIDKDERLFKTLAQIGYRSVDHLPDLTMNGVSAKVGEDLVKYGFSERGDMKVKRQSRHFVCTSCHNIEREDPNLSFADPEARLEYVHDKGMPFLPATTLYGAVNRKEFYNDDYVKKYGKLVEPARHDIREAIKLCAVECAQGRELKEWEVESILAYLWTIDLKLGDLNLSTAEAKTVASAVSGKGQEIEAIQILESKYLKNSPAHFLEPPMRDNKGYNTIGDPQNGRLVYENSCQHCHYQNKYSYLNLDDSNLTFDFLNNKADTYSRYSIYQVIRYGTYSKGGKSSYMPRFPKEKMSDQQMEDLRSYIELMAE